MCKSDGPLQTPVPFPRSVYTGCSARRRVSHQVSEWAQHVSAEDLDLPRGIAHAVSLPDDPTRVRSAGPPQPFRPNPAMWHEAQLRRTTPRGAPPDPPGPPAPRTSGPPLGTAAAQDGDGGWEVQELEQIVLSESPGSSPGAAPVAPSSIGPDPVVLWGVPGRRGPVEGGRPGTAH